MRHIIVLVIIISCTGCTTLRPIDGTSTVLQQRINSGQLLKAGDRVEIVTTDHQTHRFAVTKIDAGLIEGKAESIQVDQVVSLEGDNLAAPELWYDRLCCDCCRRCGCLRRRTHRPCLCAVTICAESRSVRG